ncbi:hypothetical protein OG384_04195 [Streptomyces sp. NBC_01324]|uniref:hypothetical protein n=1 Tax=Streptomyces sp. NBC_01324 TaxID=2903826 RepID=UPI002E14AECF|nr:hypothetical protein OG384_04195 [Streptomyces sp. NBC_01324]
MSYRMGDPVHTPTIRCPKPGCDLLLINDEACGCTWPAEPDPDPLLGQALVAFDMSGKRIAAGTVTAVDRTDGRIDLTVEQCP